MSAPRLPRVGLALGGVALLGAHAVVLHHVARLAPPHVASLAVAVVVVASHTGLFARARERLRRRP